MIRKVAFQNFKVLADVEVELEPFTVLVGPNASGKSTILDGLNRITHTITRFDMVNVDYLVSYDFADRKMAEDSPENILTKGTTGPIKFSASSMANENEDFKVVFSQDTTNTWYISGSFFSSKSRYNPIKVNEQRTHLDLDWIPKSIHLRLSGEKIAKPSYSAAKIPQLLTTGGGLAAVLADIALRDDTRYEKIQEGLRQIVPTVKRVRLERAEVPERDWIDHQLGPVADKTAIGNKIVVDFENAKGIPAEDISEGTLFALAILTVATDIENNWLILLDDIERGLHPIACGDLVKVLKNLVKEFPKLQIVATTHSPYLLNFVEPEEVRVVSLDEEGHTVVAKLTDHPDFGKWKDALLPGEFWGEVGESWVAERRVKQ